MSHIVIPDSPALPRPIAKHDIRPTVALAIAVAGVLSLATALSIYMKPPRTVTILSAKSIIEAHGPVLFVAKEASFKEGRLTLSSALTLSDDSKMEILGGKTEKYRNRFLVLCRDQLDGAILEIHQSTTMTTGSPAPESFPLATAMAKRPCDIDIPKGGITIVEIGDFGEVVRSQSEQIAEVIFEYR